MMHHALGRYRAIALNDTVDFGIEPIRVMRVTTGAADPALVVG